MSSSDLRFPDFTERLRQGRGDAVIRANEATGRAHRDAILDACTRFTGYDFQAEGSRAEYLFDVLVATGLREALEAPILAALGQRGGHWDREQLLELALLFAFDGSRAAAQAIQDTFVRCVDRPERPGAEPLVRARGLPGLVLAAQELGRVLSDSGADWAEAHVLEVAETHFGAESARDALTRAGAGDPRVRRFLEAVQQYRTESAARTREPKRPLPFPATFEGLRAAVLDGDRPPATWVLRRWALEAPAPELARAADALRDALPGTFRDAIVRAFTARDFPGEPRLLLGVLDDADEATMEAAWTALGRVKSPEVRARAIEELSRPAPRLDALQGLERSFQPADEAQVAAILAHAKSDDEVHVVGLTLLDLADAGGGSHLGPILQTVYERGVCGVCRHSAVKRMHALGVAPRTVLDECRRDAFLELRADATAWTR